MIAQGELPGEVIPPRIGVPVGRQAVVAGRHDDDQAGLHRARDRAAQRVGGGRLGDRVAERQVDDADVVAPRVGNRPVDAGDDVARVARAVAAEHAHVDEVHTRRAAARVRRRHPRGCGRASADDARDVRAVPERIARDGRLVRDEVDPRDDAPGERRMVGDARIDDGDADAAARDARLGEQAEEAASMPAQTLSARVTLLVIAMSATTGRSPEMCAMPPSAIRRFSSAEVRSSERAPASWRRSPRPRRTRSDVSASSSPCTITRTRAPLARAAFKSSESVGRRCPSGCADDNDAGRRTALTKRTIRRIDSPLKDTSTDQSDRCSDQLMWQEAVPDWDTW